MKNLLHPLLATLVLSLAAPARAAEPTPAPTASPVVEMASFRLKPGATPAQLVAASPAVDRFLQSCPGFISRLLVAGPEGLYTDIVLWRSQADADAALKKHEQEPEACSDYLCLMREDAGEMRHLPVLHAAPAGP